MASAAEILYAGALLDVAKRINDNSGPKSISKSRFFNDFDNF